MAAGLRWATGSPTGSGRRKRAPLSSPPEAAPGPVQPPVAGLLRGLPMRSSLSNGRGTPAASAALLDGEEGVETGVMGPRGVGGCAARSEERRVGEEGQGGAGWAE